MTRTALFTPTSDAEVFELLHTTFGIGSWDEDGPVPWHKFRMREISKIKAMRTKRRLRYEDFQMIVEYCLDRNLHPTESWKVLSLYDEARRHRLLKQRAAPSSLDLEVQQALDNERSRPDGDASWIQRLQLAVGPARREVLQEWRRERT